MISQKQSNYRLIWFHHLEKTAGSTVVRLARSNGEHFVARERNGIPVDDRGFIPLWDYSPKQLQAFVDACEHRQTTFVSSAFIPPDFAALAADERVSLVATLRNPVSRFVSAFKYEYLRVGHHRDISAFRASAAPTAFSFHKFDNYYCRVFSRDWQSRLLSPGLVEAAMVSLGAFDVVATIESSAWTERLCQRLGWAHYALHVNASSVSPRMALSMIRRGKVGQLGRMMFRAPFTPTPQFLDQFRNDNGQDVWLYDAARTSFERPRRMLEKASGS